MKIYIKTNDMSQSTCIILIFLQHMSKTAIEFYTP